MAEEQQEKTGAELVVETVEKVNATLDTLAERQKATEEKLEEVKKVHFPYGQPNQAPGVRVGEDPLSSRPLSLARLCLAYRQPSDYAEVAKHELEVSRELRKHFELQGWSPAGLGFCFPFSTDHMPRDDSKTEDGQTLQPFPAELIEKCRQGLVGSYNPDLDQARWVAKRAGYEQLYKDLSSQVSTTGGTLVGLPAQGELIDLLRPLELFSRVGAQEMALPPQGSVRFPRDTGDPTIDAFAEAGTITESTPSTGELTLTAKKYAGLVDIPVELMKFATSVSVEAWLRGKFVRRVAIKTDRDMIDGAGGTKIKGVITYSGLRVVIASTTGANGDTLEAEDPSRLMADIEDQDARTDESFFFALRPNLWQRVSHRRADSVTAGDKAGPFLFNTAFDAAAAIPRRLEGEAVVKTTQIPRDRAKGSATDLTLLLAGVGRSWMIARSGVVEIDMTDSDGTKFGQGLNTMRGMVFMDAGPEHEEEFGIVDDLLETT